MKKLVMGILAHVDAGKTTLSEGLLYQTGSLRKLGRVDHGDTFLDTHELERGRGITIFSKQAVLKTDDLEITLLDTPGHTDFSAEMERTLQVLDCAVLVISGTDGIQAHTETLWGLLEQYRIPTFLFVTKMDVSAFTRQQLMEELSSHLSVNCVDFSSELSEESKENLAMGDEDVLERYLSHGELSHEDIAKLMEKRQVFPCYFGSGLKLQGLDELLRGVNNYGPRKKWPQAFGAKVYKILRDSQGNRMTMAKITGGSLTVRSALRYLPMEGDEPKEEKITQLRKYNGQKFENIESVCAGDICAILGLSGTRPGQGLGIEPDSEAPMLEPALGYRVILPEQTDPVSILPKLKLLEDEDPMLRFSWHPQWQEIHVELMGSIQMDVLKKMISDRFHVEVEIGAGHILYRETIADTVEGVGHYEPLRHYAEVHLLLEPGEAGSGLVFDSRCSEDTLDLNWQRLILTHLGEKAHPGVLIGAPLTDVKITVMAGRAHLKHTEGGDFRQATYRAIRQGLMQAKSVLLEPYYQFRLEVPASQIGRAINDIKAMSGEHDTPREMGDRMVLTGTAPVATMADYLTEVVSYTRGRGRFSCHVAGYRPCHNQDAVVREMAYDPCSDLDNPPDSIFCSHGAGITIKWNEVPLHMHLPSVLTQRREQDISPARRTMSLDDKELEEIMTREFGPIRRKSYSQAGTSAKTAEVFIQSAKREHLIIDGYNVIFAWDHLKALAADNLDLARRTLEDILANYQGYTKSEVVLVFDAYKVPGGRGSRQTSAGLHIAYTKEGESADMYIERIVHDIGKNESVRVVTSDSLIRLSALRTGVLRTGSREFQNEVNWVLERIRSDIQEKR